MNYDEWQKTVPAHLTQDALWQVSAYRLALFAADIAWKDVTRLMEDLRTRGLSDQLYRACGSISANLAEGYSRMSGRDRARFYEYALGSARETRGWYFKARHVLSEAVTDHRLGLHTELVRLLIVMVPDQRANSLREERVRSRSHCPSVSKRSSF